MNQEPPPDLLSEQILDGIGSADIRFGKSASPLPSHTILKCGEELFAPRGDDPAVAALLTNDRASVELLLGALAHGAHLISLPLPPRSVDPTRYVTFIRDALALHNLTEVIARDDIVELLRAFEIGGREHSSLRSPLSVAGGAFRLTQFTSGTTDVPKSITLDDAQLGANVAAIVNVIEPGDGDQSVSWLPLSHDMGLIGMLFTSLASGRRISGSRGELTLLDPVDFLRDPSIWLHAMSERSCTVTAAPDFGYRLIADHQRGGTFDLSRLRCAIVGGEVIRSDTLNRCVDAYSTAGWRSAAFCPAYGLAEVGVAVSLTPMSEHWREFTIEEHAVAGRAAEHDGPSRVSTPLAMVSSGLPLKGYEVVVSGAYAGEIGAISVAGPSIGVDGQTGEPLSDEQGRLSTGDLGLMIDEWIYVTGRWDDHVVAHGRKIYAPAVEHQLSNLERVRSGRTGVVVLPSGEVVVVLEPQSAGPSSSREDAGLRQEIRTAMVSVCGVGPDRIVVLGRGQLPLTSSGKLQRSEIVRRLIGDEFAVT